MDYNNDQKAAGAGIKVFLIAATLGLAACGDSSDAGGAGGGAGPGDMPPMPVTVAEVRFSDVAQFGEYAGRARGAREVEVRARVGGILEQRLYTEGDVVDEGDPLFQIDPRPYEIALQQAEAELANAQAAVNQAQREETRIVSLFERDAVSERERDNAVSERELAEARLEAVEAGLAEARLNLEYSRVTAPIPGVTGLETVSEGSLIEAGALLTTLVQRDPIHVRFALPTTAVRDSDQPGGGGQNREVRLLLSDGRLYDTTGEVNFTDSTVDPRTGRIAVRAVFANPDGEVLPGQFVRVRILLRRFEDVVQVDPEAVGEGPEGPRVFVLSEDDVVEARQVQLGPVIDGRQIITAGLEGGERIVVNGQVALQDGMTVAVNSANGEDI